MHSVLRIAFLLLLPTTLTAQTPEAPPPAPPQTNTPADAPLNPALPTVFIVGDSTARNGADLGWGDHFAPLFDTSRINVANRARAGRSSRTYINEGLWTKTLAEIKSGDFVLIQMGHNDGGDLGGAKPRGTLKGIGEETKDVPIKIPQPTGPLAGQTTETVHTYGWYIRKYITESRARGATPILLTVTIRNIWKDGKIERDMGYRDLEYQIALAQHVPIADMAALEADRLQALGPEATAKFFPIDHTHSSAEGAVYIAIDVQTALRKIDSPLVKYFGDAHEVMVDLMRSRAADGSEDRVHARFLADKAQMETFAIKILAEAHAHNRDEDLGRFAFVPLTPGVTRISHEEDVMTWPGGKPRFVLFTTFSGVLSSFSGYVYSEAGNPPPKQAFTGNAFEIEPIAPHWFWYSSSN
jgi:lysophospholipase L1-like esterase